MKKAFEIRLEEYSTLLKQVGLSFTEEDKYLRSGKLHEDFAWPLFLTARTLDTKLLLQRILPVIKQTGLSFRVIKNQLLQYQLNAGAFGESEVGKVVCLYPESLEEAHCIVSMFTTLTKDDCFKGPEIKDATRISNLLYTINTEGNTSKCPFSIDKRFKKQKFQKIIGSHYIPIRMIRSSPKGDIYKAINIRKFAFNWCLIKQGKPAALDDHFQRDMRDRLLWQKQVIEDLSKMVLTPRCLDFLEVSGSSYLIMEFAEGESLGNKILHLLKGRNWKQLNIEEHLILLNWFRQVLEIISKIHKLGYVHRDITDSNFVVLEDGRLCVIDFELSYSVEKGLPEVPFVLGTQGYVAPEQLNYAIPDVKEDIYSIGALLCFILSGMQPAFVIAKTKEKTRSELNEHAADPPLVSLAMNCLSPEREKRPAMNDIQERTHQYYNTLKRNAI